VVKKLKNKEKIRKMRILLNYDYRYYPYTTASYIEMAIKQRKDITMFRLGEDRIPCADIYINIEPCQQIIRYPGRKSCFWEIDNHIHQADDIEKYTKIDKLFITQKHYLPLYKDYNATWLPLACDPEKHKLYPDETIEYDVGFLGNNTYPYRRELLDRIRSKYKLLMSTAPPGEEYSRMLSKCKILFNCSMDNDMNMRFFEAISIGRLLITDKVEGQDEMFEDGKEYISFKDWPDLDKKIEYYLNHEKEREKIAKRGSERAHHFHTYTDRLNKMLEVIGI